MATVAQRRTKGCRTLRLPLAQGEYEHFARNNEFARQLLSSCIGATLNSFHPGLPRATRSMGLRTARASNSSAVVSFGCGPVGRSSRSPRRLFYRI